MLARIFIDSTVSVTSKGVPVCSPTNLATNACKVICGDPTEAPMPFLHTVATYPSRSWLFTESPSPSLFSLSFGVERNARLCGGMGIAQKCYSALMPICVATIEVAYKGNAYH